MCKDPVRIFFPAIPLKSFLLHKVCQILVFVWDKSTLCPFVLLTLTKKIFSVVDHKSIKIASVSVTTGCDLQVVQISLPSRDESQEIEVYLFLVLLYF